MRLLLLIAGVLCAAVAFATTYKWVDEKGVVHYSDRPAAGAEVVDVPEAQTFTAEPTRTAATPGPRDQNASDQQQAPYVSLDLWKPENDETIANTGNQVTVRLRIEPDLRPGHSIWLYLDGKRVDGLPGSGETFVVPNVWRGTHTIAAVVTDSQAKELIRSQTVTFHLRQPSLLAPRRPN